MDFVLWKPSDAATPGWESPWGRGRPGWHIECSAMAKELLGLTFDIHGGGNDLTFPHHENELAQSRCAHPEGDFARIWMHNGMLNVEREKMSKSLGNFFTVRELLDEGIPGAVARFVLLSTHYRQPIDWTRSKVEEATALFGNWERVMRHADAEHGAPDADADPDPKIVGSLADDLNTSDAIHALHELVGRVRLGDRIAWNALRPSLALLGVKIEGFRDAALEASINRAFDTVGLSAMESFKDKIDQLLAARRRAREMRDFDRADAIRQGLTAAGIMVMDRNGAASEWDFGADFDPSKLEALS